MSLTPEQAEKLHLVFSVLPPEVQDWLGSDEAARLTEEINSRRAFNGEQGYVIPELLFRLVTEDLAPAEFTATLKEELKIDLETSRALTKEIKEKILEPIAQPLGILGIDIGQMGYVIPVPTTIPLEISRPEAAEVERSLTGPFIIHEEGGVQPIGPIAPIKPVAPIGQLTPTTPPKVIIERVVHYSPFRTPLTHANPHQEKRSKMKIPKSRWFI